MITQEGNRLRLPEKYRPLSAWAYLGYQILFAIPVVGLVLLIIYSLDNTNINRRNFARSYFCLIAVLVVILLVILVLGGLFMSFGMNE